ncbi:MAG: tryptophan 7-halogenase [Rhodobacteraceae bacterium]|nr:tryptophan 7-halogenase [Paracoccaceae bacterium]
MTATSKPVEHITIVGGGTAGWLAANLLSNFFGTGNDQGVKRHITLIESPNIATVGVGEATVPAMPRMLRQTGISEREFFKATNASFKLGVKFGNWNHDANGKPIDYINPFIGSRDIDGIPMEHYFHALGAKGLNYVQSISATHELGEMCKGPRALGKKEFDKGTSPYAYHLDAGKFAGMLQKVCVGRGVTHLRDDVVDVELDDKGFVAALQLKENGRFPVQLVIDCTGFRGLIINQALKEPFVDYQKYLANDRAMAVQIPHPDKEKLLPLTCSTALGAGWVWRVPLWNRIGTGYVFSSAHRTDEQARDELMAHLGDGAKGLEPRVIPMRIGRTRKSWVKNCVAIGLSAGFIEPLESTAIHMTEMAIRWLLTYFPDQEFSAPKRDRYNKLANNLYDEVRDFICIHYAMGNRTDDPYWIDAREGLEVPDSLAENLELWKYNLPAEADVGQFNLFSPGTYRAVLFGKKVYENGYGGGRVSSGIALDPDKWDTYLENLRKTVRVITRDMADHRTLLAELRGELRPAAQPWALTGGQAPTVQVPGAAKMPRFKVPDFVTGDADNAIL